jgi:ATPase subunit of ABC transporter with duplicated ATPase domains
MVISVSNLELIIGNKTLIREGFFTLNKGDKIALIGRNGSGKSSLIELIYGLYSKKETLKNLEYRGKINFGPEIKIAFLPQEVKFSFRGAVKDYIRTSGGKYAEIFERYKELSSRMQSGDLSQQEIEEYGEIIEKMKFFDLWDFEDRKKKILEKLGLTEEVLKRDVQTLSGGESTKIALAGVLLSDANFWILDEPTNNLDEEGVNLLFEELEKFKGTVLIITHDRRLLNILGRILEIDEETKKIRVWGGNYEFYKTKREEEFQSRMRKYEEQEAKRKRLEEELRNLKQQAQQFERISKNAFQRARGAKLAKRAKSMEIRIERELQKLTEPQPPQRPKFLLKEIKPIKGNLIRVENLSYFLGEKNIFTNLNFDVDANQRIWIRGPIGSGKTTLLKCIVGEFEPSSGKVKIREGLKIGYLPQTPIIKDKKQKVKDYLEENFDLTEYDIRKILKTIKMEEIFNIFVGNLSVGEIRKLQIGALLFKGPDILILDEPTNHLDIYTIEELVEALKQYKGTIIFTSHDLSFVNDLNPNKQIICGGKL